MSDLEAKIASSVNSSNDKYIVSSGEVHDFSNEVDPVLERKTLRKFDKCLLPPLAIILLLAYLDRSNLGMVSILTNFLIN